MIILSLLLALSCATTASQGTTRTVVIDGAEMLAEDHARALLDEGNAAARDGDNAKAKELLTRVTKEYADTTSFSPASVSLARILLDEGDAKGAQALVERVLMEDPTTPVADDARYVLALAQLKQGDSKSAAPTLKNLVDRIPEEDRAEAFSKLGRQLLEQGQGTEGVRYVARAIEAGAPDKAELEALLVRAVDADVPFGDLRLLLESEAKPNTLLDEVLTFKLARVHLHLRDLPSASQMAQRYLSRYPSGRYAAQARDLSTTLAAKVAVDPKAIGVLLPLSGDYKAYGERALTAIKIGFAMPVKGEPTPEPVLNPETGEMEMPKKQDKKLEGTFTSPDGFKLIVRDTGGDPTKARDIVQDLVEKDHVIAVLGDILLDTSLPAALAAEENNVPILSLSRRDGVPEAGPWSFRLALTAKKQAQALARLAVEGMGMRRFAIMYPKHAFGVELMNEFWDALEKREAEVTAVESYAHDQTTFTSEAKSLVGRGMAGSSEVVECKREAQNISNDYRRRKAIEGCNDLAKPVIDFEALFIPDSYRSVSYVVPALVAEDVLLTKHAYTVKIYQKTTGNEKVRPVQLLGVSMWNDPELTRRLGRERSIDGALFVDGFDPNDGTPVVQRFVQAFASVHGGRPQLVEAQSHDGAALLYAQLKNGAKTRDGLRSALQSTKDFPGVTGLVKFDEQGDSQTELRYFMVEGERIDAKDPATLVKNQSGE